MPNSIYVQHLAEQPNSNLHHLNRLIKLLNHFISIEPEDKPKGFECHHIVPKSWRPEWEFEKDNLLKVSAKAHYIIHHLMYKAFSENGAMIKAFWYFANKNNYKITARIFMSLRQKVNEAQRKYAKERVANGTHNWLNGEIQRKTNAERIVNGTHNFLGGDLQRKRIEDGTHHFTSDFAIQVQKERVINRNPQLFGFRL